MYGRRIRIAVRPQTVLLLKGHQRLSCFRSKAAVRLADQAQLDPVDVLVVIAVVGVLVALTQWRTMALVANVATILA